MLGWIRFPATLWDEVQRLEREIDRIFTGWPVGIREAGGMPLFPTINVGRTPEALYIYCFAPGIDPAKTEITLEQGVLTIAGERGPWAAKEGETVHARERFSGKFKRTVSLPDEVDPDQVEARYRDGVLTIRIGRKTHLLPRRIEIA